MSAFAGNSVLARLALGGDAMDAASYTTLRLAAGAVMLVAVLAASRHPRRPQVRDGWFSAAVLLTYAVTFSYAYVSLSTGTGALILFGAVQATMILAALRGGERPRWPVWVGLAIALGGLILLVRPGLTAPAPAGSMLMAVAGIAWGVYSLRGRSSSMPLVDTTASFVLALPLAAAASLASLPLAPVVLTAQGVALAVLSGAVTSGLGYVAWYAALPGLTATRASVVQLAVPVLAAVAGVLLLSEPITSRLVIAGALILGGVALSVTARTGAVYQDGGRRRP